jgi:hypothetical protein
MCVSVHLFVALCHSLLERCEYVQKLTEYYSGMLVGYRVKIFLYDNFDLITI